MRFLFRNLFLGLSVTLLAACGGGDDGPRVAAPTASVSVAPTTLEVGATATFTGSGSSPNGGSLAYQWTLASKPAGSAAALQAAAQKALLTPDKVGDYVVRLVVNDGAASSSAAEVTLKAISYDPVANAGDDINTLVSATGGGPVQLDGTNSQPPEGGDAAKLAYQWTLTKVPDGSKAALDDAANAKPRFTADVVGTYKASLVVTYGGRTSKPDEVVVNVVKANVPAIVDFSVNGQSTSQSVKVNRGQKVLLDASASYDPDTPSDKSKLQYRWSFSSGFSGYGSTAVIENDHSAQASFTPNVVGNISITLQIFDGVSVSNKIVTVGVVKPAGEANLAPGVISPLVPYSNNTYEAELGASFRPIGYGGVYDPDYGYPYPTYEWTWLSYPAGWDPVANSDLSQGNASTFKPTIAGDYKIQLRAHDADGAYSNTVIQTYTALLGANRSPTAAARISTGNASTLVGTSVTFDGTSSSDPDDNRLTYAWTLADRPDGSAAQLQNPNSATPALVPDVPGPYVASLVVTDSHGFASPKASKVTLLAKSQNHAPSVRATVDVSYDSDQPMVLAKGAPWTYTNGVTGVTETLEQWASFNVSSNGFDPDGDNLTYLWNLTQEPAGNAFKMPVGVTLCQNGQSYSDAWGVTQNVTWATYWTGILALKTWDCPNVSLAPSAAGTYKLELLAYDGTERVGPYTVTVPVVDRTAYPTLLVEQLNKPTDTSGTQRIFPYKADLSTFYQWSPVGYPDTAAKNGDTAAYFRLTAYDRDYTFTEVSVVASGAGFKPNFGGLVDNQVLRKGESIVISLNAVVDTANEPQAGSIDRPITWSFKVAQRPEWTFVYQPSIFYFRP